MSGDDYALAGAYVLDALDEQERERFEAFLATSPEAQAEVDSLREAAALLGAAAAAETPPARLKQAVLDQIDTVRQLPPIVTDLASPGAVRRGPRPMTRERVSTLSRAAAAVAAVVAVVAVGLGVAVVQLGTRLDSLEAANAQIAAVVAAADAQQLAVALPDGGRVSAVVSPGQGSAIVVGDDLRPLDGDRIYALWSIVDGVPLPVGELLDGRALAVDAEGLEALGVTIEPRGPLHTPTTEPIGVLTV